MTITCWNPAWPNQEFDIVMCTMLYYCDRMYDLQNYCGIPDWLGIFYPPWMVNFFNISSVLLIFVIIFFDIIPLLLRLVKYVVMGTGLGMLDETEKAKERAMMKRSVSSCMRLYTFVWVITSIVSSNLFFKNDLKASRFETNGVNFDLQQLILLQVKIGFYIVRDEQGRAPGYLPFVYTFTK